MNLERVKTIVPAKRNGKASNGKIIPLFTNYFPLTQKLNSLMVNEYTITFEEITYVKGKRSIKEVKNRDRRASIFWKLKELQNEFFKYLLAFDGWGLVWTINHPTEKFIESIPNEEKRNCDILVTVAINSHSPFRLDMNSLDAAICQSSSMALKNMLIQGIRHPENKASENYFTWKGTVYPIPGKTTSAVEIKIFDDVKAWLGLFASIKYLENNQPVVNFGLINSLFHSMDIDLVTFFGEVLNSLDMKYKTEEWQKRIVNLEVRPEHIERLDKALKGMSVRTKPGYSGAFIIETDKDRNIRPVFLDNRHFIIKRVVNVNAMSYFPQIRDNGKLYCLKEWYDLEWNGEKRPLRYPYLPLIEVEAGKGRTKSAQCLPMEVLFTRDTPQRYSRRLPDYFSKRDYIKKVTRGPTEYADTTLRLLGEFLHDVNKASLRSMEIKPELLQLQGTELKPPVLRGKNGKEIKILPENKSYRELELAECPKQKVSLSIITIGGFLRKANKSISWSLQDQEAKDFVGALSMALEARGLRLSEKCYYHKAHCEIDVQGVEPLDDVVNFQLKVWKQDCKEELPLFIIFSSRNFKNAYGHIKRLLDNDVGIASQVIDRDTARDALKLIKTDLSIYYNISLKINAKLGGVNVTADNFSFGDSQDSSDSSIMYVGIDVTHPDASDPDSLSNISIASMVASTDSSGTKYVHKIYAQMKAKEQIECFDKQFQQLMFQYMENNKKYPDHVVIYRDGVGDTQLLHTASQELHWIRTVWESISGPEGPKPTFTYIVVQKRHRTRFFIENTKIDEKNGKYGNMKSGTVVDSIISSHVLFDFWLAGQHGATGTTRPAHYIVVYDDWNLSADAIYEMTYRLCFLNARCRKPISLPTPVHYADLICQKAKEKYRNLIDYGIIKFSKDADSIMLKNKIEKLLDVHIQYPGMSFA